MITIGVIIGHSSLGLAGGASNSPHGELTSRKHNEDADVQAGNSTNEIKAGTKVDIPPDLPNMTQRDKLSRKTKEGLTYGGNPSSVPSKRRRVDGNMTKAAKTHTKVDEESDQHLSQRYKFVDGIRPSIGPSKSDTLNREVLLDHFITL